MPGPTCTRSLKVGGQDSGVVGVKEIASMKDELSNPQLCDIKATVIPGLVSVGGNGTEDGGVLKEKKRNRRKRRKTNLANLQNGPKCNGIEDNILDDVGDLTALATGNCRSGPSNGEATESSLQKPLRGVWPGNDADSASTMAGASVNVKITSKKRKRLDRSMTDSSSVAASKETVTEDDRVWQYVCKRAVLVDVKGHLKSPMSGIKSFASKPNGGLIPGSRQKTTVSEITAAGKTVVVTNTKEGAVAQEWILRQEGKVFGLDAEWRPSFSKGTEHKVALLQICGESECLIVQMLYLDSIPPALVDFLKNPRILFPGVGVSGDAKKLQRDWGLECRGVVDLTSLAADALGRPELKSAGLKTLAKVVIDFDMAKPKRVTMSNWARPVLDKIQVEYASLDAWVSYAIHQRLVEAPFATDNFT